MFKPRDPRELAIAIMKRSMCSVQVGACIADNYGIFAWGHNSSGPDGYGLCAERHAISRANKKRLKESTIYIVGKRRKSGSYVNAYPCLKCRAYLKYIRYWMYCDRGQWKLVRNNLALSER